jgi:hypothetical protein
MEVATPSTYGGNPMILPEPLLVILVKLVNRIPMPPPLSKRKRGHPYVYPDRLFLQALESRKEINLPNQVVLG